MVRNEPAPFHTLNGKEHDVLDTFAFRCRDERGDALAAGVYLLRFAVPGAKATALVVRR